MSSDDIGDEPKYSAYDHLKREAAKKSTSTAASAGTPAIMKVFFIGIILIGGLMVSGVLTNDPFNTGNNGGGSSDPFNNPGGGDTTYDLSAQCVNHDNSLSAHYHFDLSIFIDGEQQTIPANIGIDGECLKPMHTHSTGGYVHVELPGDYSGSNPTISLLFEVWPRTFTSDSLFGQTGTISMEINGNTLSSDPTLYRPVNGDNIVISLVTS